VQTDDQPGLLTFTVNLESFVSLFECELTFSVVCSTP
jgi:hypothetical protein